MRFHQEKVSCQRLVALHHFIMEFIADPVARRHLYQPAHRTYTWIDFIIPGLCVTIRNRSNRK